MVNISASIAEQEGEDSDGVILCPWKQGLIGIGRCIQLRHPEKCNGCKHNDEESTEFIHEQIREKKRGNNIKAYLTKEEGETMWDEMRQKMAEWEDD